MTTMLEFLNSAERIQANWPRLTETEKTLLESETIITRIIRAVVNLDVQGDIYTGRIDVQATYLHVETGLVVGQDSWYSEKAPASVVHPVLGYGITLWPKAVELLMLANGGTMPSILPPRVEPVEPEPAPSPNPIGPPPPPAN